jgi:hypothetical protein
MDLHLRSPRIFMAWRLIKSIDNFASTLTLSCGVQTNSMSQEERSIFWDVTVPAILSKKYICTCILYRTVSEIQLFHCTVPKLLKRKTYYALFLIPIFIVQVTKLVITVHLVSRRTGQTDIMAVHFQ